MKTQSKTAPVIVGVILCFSAHLGFSQTANKENNATSEKKYDVAAFIWPSYHPDDRAKIFWPMGIGEWETVLFNKRLFEGTEQPRHPLWGYINEADPYVMQMQIDAAADHGINVFIFDWYWYDGMPFLQGCLDDGYLKAKNNDRVRFYVMWANHDVPMIWDKRNADDAMNKKNKALIWRGGVNLDEFKKIAKLTITKYFSHPSYYKIDGKPVYMIYELPTFVNGIGGPNKAKEALDWFRSEVVKAGYKGLELQIVLHGDSSHIVTEAGDERALTQRELVNFLGIDSVTHYQFVSFLNVDREYDDVLKDAKDAWEAASKSYSARYYPQVSIGWDNSPRTVERVAEMVKNNTPEKFEKALLSAKDFIDAHPEQAPLITINSWNEWTEGSYLQPDDRYGYGYLDAVKQAFKN